MTTDRRRFLVSSAAVVGGVMLLDLAGCGGGDELVRARQQLAIDVAALLPTHATDLGRRWGVGESMTILALATALFEGLRWADLAPSSGPPGVVDQLRAQISCEHRAGDIERVGGWRLARTELLLCALAARSGG